MVKTLMMLFLSSSVFALQTPKGNEVQSSLGSPMNKALKPLTFVMLPPTNVNVSVTMFWTPTPNVSYQVVIGTNLIGTNFVGTTWSTITTNTSITTIIQVPDDNQFVFGRIRLAGATNVLSEIVRSPNWRPDAVAVWWSKPANSAVVWMEVSTDVGFHNFAAVQPQNPPMIVPIMLGQSQFYRILGAPVTMSINPLWQWDDVLKHFGGKN